MKQVYETRSFLLLVWRGTICCIHFISIRNSDEQRIVSDEIKRQDTRAFIELSDCGMPLTRLMLLFKMCFKMKGNVTFHSRI